MSRVLLRKMLLMTFKCNIYIIAILSKYICSHLGKSDMDILLYIQNVTLIYFVNSKKYAIHVTL